jgi:type I restriction enzyme S subunit
MKIWKRYKIIDFCYVTDFVSNGSFASLKENVNYTKYPEYAVLVRLTDFTKNWNKDFVYVSKASYDFLKKSSLVPNDLIMSNVGEPGIVFLVPDLNQPMTLGPNSILIRPTEDSSTSKFLYLYFLSAKGKKQIDDISTGAAQKKFNKTSFRDIEIPLPSLPEQQAIVAILDEAFAAIAQAKANAEQNLQNANELFESYLQSVFENKGEGWEEKEFGSVITTLTDYHANGSYEVLKSNVELKDTEDYAWMVRSTDFENNFKNSFRYIDKNSYDFLSKSKIFGGEIIMSKIGNAGNVYLMPKSNRPCSLAMNLFLIRINENVAISEFIYQYLKSKKGEVQIKSRLLGMATKTITKDNVRNIVIPFPPLKEQQTIVQKLDALSTETKQLEAIYQQKINDLDELKKSILQKAFAGELNTSSLELEV